MISVKHLTKCYGEFTAVDDLSFEIDEGHVYGFLGPNGAGKSTTMNIITGWMIRNVQSHWRRTMRLMKSHWVIIVPWIHSVMFQSEMEMCTL